VFQKSSPPKTFWNIFTLVKFFLSEILQICWQFISTYTCQFLYIYINISSNGVNCSTSRLPVVFIASSFEYWMQTLREQGLGETAIITMTRWKLSTGKKVCSRVDHTGSAVLRTPGSGTGRPATASVCAVCRCKTIFPSVALYEALKQCH